MRRYTFYLSVALLAFGIGLFVVFKFYIKPNEQPFIVEKPQTVKNNLVSKTDEDFAVDLTNAEFYNGLYFVCEDKELKVFWLDFLREKDIQESLPKTEYRSIVVYNCSERLRTRRFDLNNDGNVEYIVELISVHVCGAKSNCPRVIYEQKNGEFKRLLSHKASLLIEPKNTKTRGYQDLEIFFNTEPNGGYVEKYKFDGKIYKLKNCFNVDLNNSLERTKCWDL